jgi:curli biogenesis system outer membrane secretion channel CsgG
MKRERFFAALFLSGLTVFLLLLAAGGSPAFAGKPRLAVITFDTQGIGPDWWDHKEDIEFELNALFVNELVKSGKFTVIERQRLDAIMQEQQLSLAGNVDPSSAVKAGKMLGVDLMLTGRITKFGFREVGGEGAFGLALSAKKKTLEGGISVRLINTTTGEILFADEALGEDSHFKITVATFGGGVDYDETMVDKVFRPGVEELCQKISGSSGDMQSASGPVTITGKISKIAGGEIYLNVGSADGMTVGRTFTVYSVGEAIVDPDSGEKLGAEETESGRIEVTEVKEKFSKAKVVSGSGFKVGDMIR